MMLQHRLRLLRPLLERRPSFSLLDCASAGEHSNAQVVTISNLFIASPEMERFEAPRFNACNAWFVRLVAPASPFSQAAAGFSALPSGLSNSLFFLFVRASQEPPAKARVEAVWRRSAYGNSPSKAASEIECNET